MFATVRCPCGGGQSCIVERRAMRDWVHEDDVLDEAGVERRLHCGSDITEEQERAFFAWHSMKDFPDSVVHDLGEGVSTDEEDEAIDLQGAGRNESR